MASNTYIWTKPEYTELGIRSIVRIVYNPHDEKPSKVMKAWVLPEFWHQCYGINHKIKR